jgi:hypothetical protein
VLAAHARLLSRAFQLLDASIANLAELLEALGAVRGSLDDVAEEEDEKLPDTEA